MQISLAATVIYNSLQRSLLGLLLWLLCFFFFFRAVCWGSLLHIPYLHPWRRNVGSGTFITAVTWQLEDPRFDVESVWCGVHVLSSCLLGSPSLHAEAFLALASALICNPRKQRHLNKAWKWMLKHAHTKIKPILCMLMPAGESIICILTTRETGGVCQRLPLGEDAKWCLRSLKKSGSLE